MIGAIEALGSKDVSFFANFLFDENEFVAVDAAHVIERITKQDFGFPQCGGTRLLPNRGVKATQRRFVGACSFGDGAKNAQRWWNSNKADCKQ